MRESVDEPIRVKRFTTEEEPSSDISCWTFSVLSLEPNGGTVLIMVLAALPHTVSEQLDRLSVSDQVWKLGNLQNEQASFMLTDRRSAVWMFQKSLRTCGCQALLFRALSYRLFKRQKHTLLRFSGLSVALSHSSQPCYVGLTSAACFTVESCSLTLLACLLNAVFVVLSRTCSGCCDAQQCSVCFLK